MRDDSLYVEPQTDAPRLSQDQREMRHRISELERRLELCSTEEQREEIFRQIQQVSQR